MAANMSYAIMALVFKYIVCKEKTGFILLSNHYSTECSKLRPHSEANKLVTNVGSRKCACFRKCETTT